MKKKPFGSSWNVWRFKFSGSKQIHNFGWSEMVLNHTLHKTITYPNPTERESSENRKDSKVPLILICTGGWQSFHLLSFKIWENNCGAFRKEPLCWVKTSASKIRVSKRGANRLEIAFSIPIYQVFEPIISKSQPATATTTHVMPNWNSKHFLRLWVYTLENQDGI